MINPNEGFCPDCEQARPCKCVAYMPGGSLHLSTIPHLDIQAMLDAKCPGCLLRDRQIQQLNAANFELWNIIKQEGDAWDVVLFGIPEELINHLVAKSPELQKRVAEVKEAAEKVIADFQKRKSEYGG